MCIIAMTFLCDSLQKGNSLLKQPRCASDGSEGAPRSASDHLQSEESEN